MSEKEYYLKKESENIDKLRQLISTMPEFCKRFFLGIEQSSEVSTRLGYARDISLFLRYLKEVNPEIKKKNEITLEDINKITTFDIDEYMSYLTKYEMDGVTYTNDKAAKRRKLSSLRSLFKYLNKMKMIENDPTYLVANPKERREDKVITYLDKDEVASLVEVVETGLGINMSERQKKACDKTRTRDLTIVITLLGTGIRVSELVGLNIEDVDLKKDEIKVTRKGNYIGTVTIGEEVHDAINEYIENVRNNIEPKEGHENALFISENNTRISVRSVERIVKKYSTAVTNKKITPHKLRSTHGTTLYNETGDIKGVADRLGHTNIQTTSKYYTEIFDDKKREFSNIVTLRREE